MRWLADECVDAALVRRLRTAGHDVIYAAEVASGATDAQILRRANDEDRLLLTEDKDFGELVFRLHRSDVCRLDGTKVAQSLPLPERVPEDQFSSQIRHYRPIAVDKTEVTIYCIAPKGEDAEARARRIRQYEDFFNASGMGTPDDLAEFRGCQMSSRGRAALERSEPRSRALDPGSRRSGRVDRSETADERCAHRG